MSGANDQFLLKYCKDLLIYLVLYYKNESDVIKMMTKQDARRILETALATGGDFAEVFMETTISNVLEITSREVTKALTQVISGVSVRIIKDFKEVFGYTNDKSIASIEKLAAELASSFDGSKTTDVAPFKETLYENRHPVKVEPSTEKNENKVNILMKMNEGALEYSKEIVQSVAILTDKTQDILVFASDGTWATDRRVNTRALINVVASDGKVMQTASDNYGFNQGMEMFDNFDSYKFGEETAKVAVTMLHADEMVGQELPVIIHNAFGGVILHEACGHSLEATSVAKGLSVFTGKIGEKIASDIVTAVDDGTIDNAWGSLNVDDEGTPTQRNVLIESGILKSYMVDKRNGKKMNAAITGSARRQSYKFSPTSRMTNTFFINGNATFEEIIKNTEYGFFAKKMGGGSVNPSTGEFNFAVNEGYMVENGKITKPVRGATLVGSGKDVLKRIDMIADNLSFGHGMCGSVSGSLPVNVGQPTIRVSMMTVGGKGGK
jgi:TldD protein